MISKVEIRGFTAHRKCDIEFGPNVTTLTGSSFTGKSTILHAIRFVCMNRPSGDKMISWGAEKTSVRLTIDKKKIVRRKGKGNNSYTLDKQKYEAFGNNVPQPIADLVNMSDINFQGQHDAPFWFRETAGEVSRQLNAIINLEVIDKTLANIASRIRKTKTTIEVTQERLDNAIEDKKELDYIVELDKDLVDIEKLEKAKTQIAVESTTLRDIIEGYIRHRSQRDNAAGAVSGGVAVLKKGQIWLKIKGLAETLDNHVKTGIRTTKIIQAAPESITPLDKLKIKWTEQKEKRSYLQDLICEIQNGKEKLCQIKIGLEGVKKQFARVAEGRCPICGKPMKKS